MRGRSIAAMGVLAASTLAALTLTAPAYADGPGRYQWDQSCSKGGFTGTIRTTYDKLPNNAERVKSIHYKIDKGGNRGGNNADVTVQESGITPTKVFFTGTGIQDGGFHALYLDTSGYTRGTANFAMKFIFDKSSAGDPSCTTTRYW